MFDETTRNPNPNHLLCCVMQQYDVIGHVLWGQGTWAGFRPFHDQQHVMMVDDGNCSTNGTRWWLFPTASCLSSIRAWMRLPVLNQFSVLFDCILRCVFSVCPSITRSYRVHLAVISEHPFNWKHKKIWNQKIALKTTCGAYAGSYGTNGTLSTLSTLSM